MSYPAAEIRLESRMRVTAKRRRIQIGKRSFELARSREGVMRMWAKDDVGLSSGLGFAHAHDRQVQMMLVRLVGQGRLSECLKSDENTLEIDIFMRDMGLRRDADVDTANLGPEAYALCAAYADGVNHYLGNQARPLEFALVRWIVDPGVELSEEAVAESPDSTAPATSSGTGGAL